MSGKRKGCKLCDGVGEVTMNPLDGGPLCTVGCPACIEADLEAAISSLRARVAELEGIVERLRSACKAGRTCAYRYGPGDSPEVLQAIYQMDDAINATEEGDHR